MSEKWPDPLENAADLQSKTDVPGIYCADCFGFIMETSAVLFGGIVFCPDASPPRSCPHCKSTSHNFNVVCEKLG